MIMEQTKEQTRKQRFVYLYEEAFPGFASFVKKMNGNLEDARDIFQDGLLIYYEKVMIQQLSIQVSDKAYLMGICKHLWYKKFHQKKAEIGFELAKLPLNREEEPMNVSDRIFLMIERSGKKCLDLLQSFYFEKKSMAEIASVFGFSSERSATTQKYKCLEKVRDEIKTKSMKKEDFYE
jgi:DNA-directed RNA polymerase specialized sigma24 family protein